MFLSNVGAYNMLRWYMEDFLTEVSVRLLFTSGPVYVFCTVHRDTDT